MEKAKTSSLKEYENNPRNNDGAVSAVAASIDEFGFLCPIVIDDDGVILAGHTRLKAARRLGIDEVPIITAHGLSEEQKRAFRLADNKTAELAEWDMAMLDVELTSIENIDMDDFGFMIDDIGFDDEDITEDDFDEDEPVDPRVQRGEIWKLGNHYLMCGDATRKEDVAALVDTGNAAPSLLLTDPPYNVDYEGKAGTIQNDNMADERFREFLFDALSAAHSTMKPGAAFYIWHSDGEGYNFRGACRDAGLTVRECLIWNKNSLVLGHHDYQWKHEPCLYGWKDGAPHSWYSDRAQTTVLDFDKPQRSELHPTMKPVALFSYLIGNSTKPGDVVLDTFCGSGTTLIAAEQTGRVCHAVELDPHYCDVIIARWEQLTGGEAVCL